MDIRPSLFFIPSGGWRPLTHLILHPRCKITAFDRTACHISAHTLLSVTKQSSSPHLLISLFYFERWIGAAISLCRPPNTLPPSNVSPCDIFPHKSSVIGLDSPNIPPQAEYSSIRCNRPPTVGTNPYLATDESSKSRQKEDGLVPSFLFLSPYACLRLPYSYILPIVYCRNM